ncbi:hypothetical protein HYT54_00175 [Candidatus Woesearchaeota archaeon]|nr:hypothetical protein [Candidatus Woesearchaeota archaeon]
MSKLKALELEISKIKERNKRVEADKAWETSWTRRILIFILTYIIVVSFFIFAGLPSPFINSIVPSIAFVLSTVTMPFVRGMWIRQFRKS